MPRGINKNLPRRRCDNCGKLYQPVQPLRRNRITGKEEHGFCQSNCRKEFHKYGGAYAKLKFLLSDLVAVKFKTIQREGINADWMRQIEARLANLEADLKTIREAFSFRRSA